MPAKKNPDLHGNAPDKSPAALLLIDMINALDFDGSDQLLTYALPVAKNIAALKTRCKQAGIPVIYVNDNFGRWRSDFKNLLKHCLSPRIRGKPLARILKPGNNDYFVLKPKHSGFFASSLSTLLEYLQTKTLILTGICGNICVLFTANDAYLRDYRILVPSDCIASMTPDDNQNALNAMEKVLKADTRPSTEIDVKKLQRK